MSAKEDVKAVLDATVVTVRVGENATIFEGPDTIYRYDLPGSGVLEGWALAAVVDQIKQLTSLYWPEIEVVVDADENATEILARTLLNKGVAAYPLAVLRERPLPEIGEDLEIERPTSGSTHRSLGLHPLHLAIALVIVVVAGISWWAIDLTTANPESGATEPTTVAMVARDTPTSSSPTSSTPQPGTQAKEPEVILEHAGLRVSVPPGFRPAPQEEMLMVVGEDPNLRIHLAADPVHSVPEDAVNREIERMIADDPMLTLNGGDGQGRLFYREEPGDGSEVNWTTWVDTGHQFSVGCHTRQKPTLPQKAACRMAAESLALAD